MTVTIDQIKLLINDEKELIKSHFDVKFEKLRTRVDSNSRDLLVFKVIFSSAAFFGGGGYGVWKWIAAATGG